MHYYVLLIAVLHVVLTLQDVSYRVGLLYYNDTQESSFNELARQYSIDKSLPFQLIPEAYKIPYSNTLESYKSVCKLLKKGVIGIFGPSSRYSSGYIQSISDYKEIPHIETHWDPKLERNKTLINLHPHPAALSNLLLDLVQAYEWDVLIVLYENEDSLIRVSKLLELNTNGKKVLFKYLEADEMGMFRPFFTTIRKSEERNILIDCSIHILKEVLNQLQQVGMMTDEYKYIITNLDAHTIDLSPYQFAGTNITGIRIVNPDSPKMKETLKYLQNTEEYDNGFDVVAAWGMRTESALLLDGLMLFYDTIYELTNNKYRVISPKMIACKGSTENWRHGHTIVNQMKTKSLDGLTGVVKFDSQGFRMDFRLDIVELTVGGLLKIGEWNSTTRNLDIRRVNSAVKTLSESNIFNRTFVVITTLTPPYAMLKEDTTQLMGNDRYEGFCIDVIHELSKILKFNYTFILQDDGNNGNFNRKTQKWDGMIGAIVDGQADLAITDLTITAEREGEVDFTVPFMNLGISILYRKPEPVPPSLLMFASPFSVMVWVMLGVAYCFVSFAIFVMGRLSPGEWTNPYPCVEEPEYLINQFSIRNSLWFTIGALMQQGSELAPMSVSTRMATGFWWFFVLIIVSSYTANLAAFLTVTIPVTSFKNIEELARQNIIQYGAKRGGATEHFFRDSNLSSHKQVWVYLQNHPEVMTTGNDEGVMRVENESFPYAYLMESTTIEYITERHCGLSKVGGLLDDKGYGIAMRKESPYRSELSTAILKLQETAKLTDLKIKWWKEKRGGGKCSAKSEEAEAKPLGLKNVGGVFMVLFVGSFLGCIGSCLEFLYHVYKKCKVTKVPMKEEIKKELKFFVQFKKNVKPVNHFDGK